MADTHQKRLITWRVPEDLLARIDEQAKQLGWSRARFLTWATESGLEDSRGGVPDPPAVEEKPAPQAPVEDWHTWAMERQQKLNEAKYGRDR